MSAHGVTRWVKRLGKALLVLSAILIVGVFWLLNTNHGLRFMFKQVPQIAQFGQIEGTAGQFIAEDLVIQLPSGEAQIERISLQWSMMSLLQRRVKIDSVAIAGVALRLDKPNQVSPYQPWQGIRLPIEIVLSDAVIEQFDASYRNPQASLFTFDRLALGAIYRQNLLSIDSLVLSGSAGQRDNRFAVAGQVDLSADPSGVVELRHEGQWQVSKQMIQTRGVVSGIWRELKLAQQFVTPWQAELDATLTNALSHDIGYTATLTTAAIDQQVTLAEGLELGPARLTANGQFIPKDGLPGLQARLSGSVNGGSAEFSHWRLEVETDYANDALQVRRLSMQEQLSHLTASASVTKMPTPISMSATGEIEELQDFLANVSTLSNFDQVLGKVDFSGEAQSLRWPLTGTEPYFESDARFSVVGDAAGYSLRASAQGSLQDKALTADLNARLSDEQLKLTQLRVRSGGSELAAKGSVDSLVQLEWNVNSPDLADLIPNARGQLLSDGRLSGSRSAPTVSARVRASKLQLLGISTQSMTLNVDASLSQLTQPITMRLNADNLRVNERLLASTLEASLDGTGEAHTLSLEAGLDRGATLALSVRGGIAKPIWQGQLTELSLADPILDTWTLAAPVDLVIGQQAASLSRACVINQSQSICAMLDQSATGIIANGEAENLDLSNLNRFLGAYELSVSGVANGEFDYRLDDTGSAAQISAQLQSTDSVIRWQTVNDGIPETEALEIRLVDVRLEQEQQLKLIGVVEFDMVDQARWELNFDQPFGSTNFERAILNGDAHLNIDDLSVLPPSLLNDINLNGRLAAQLEFGGTVTKPSLTMTADIVDSVAKIPELGLSLEDINLKARSNSASMVELKASLRSGSGLLDVNGVLDLGELKKPRIDLTIRGNDVQLANTPDMTVTGDLDFITKITPELVDLKGQISIDKADLDFKLPDSAVLESSDVTLEGTEESVASLKQRLDLSIDLGTNTHIKAQGLDAKLLGRLRVYQVPNGIIRGDGQIRLEDGRYVAYGQDLKIDQGRLVFNGGSIDDPALDLRAQKTVDTTTAGVAVSGRASAPRLQLYSTPAMSDQDILSVLIFGKPISQLGSQDGLTLLRIASALSGDGTGPIAKTTSKIQETLGLTDLELKLAGDAPSIQAGKQLSSKFYIGYGYGLLDATQSLILRYKLSDAWSIKADLGTNSGADLRYQVER